MHGRISDSYDKTSCTIHCMREINCYKKPLGPPHDTNKYPSRRLTCIPKLSPKMPCISRSCALQRNFQCNWAVWFTASVLLHLSLLSEQTAIAQCEQVICPPADCTDPIRLNGECCPICLDPRKRPRLYGIAHVKILCIFM